ncbi:hypothetical protein [Flavobacterium hungaricum]|uniref:Uncharacterized protein n=1 Tax=Flavobacterium hungaricum TaxID=2082725 RepID=A0ABR9TFV6_9FLAO|nr:hypothetical protein [Flavobacterium hungaricum]MBE8724176.1 hypothetical protein [Flavobacterium hungaricum]
MIKNIWAAFLIMAVLLPMFLFLNPFAWGMRRAPEYVPSVRLETVLEQMRLEISQEEQIQIDTYNNTANLWYLRDCENKKLDSLENLNIELSEIKNEAFIEEKIKKFEPLIQKEIECKCYDSLVFSYSVHKEAKADTKDSDTLEYDFQKESEPRKVVIGFKIRKQ